jgi:hypothetical protein
MNIFPQEIWCNTSTFLTLNDFINLRLTCWKMNTDLNESVYVWNNQFINQSKMSLLYIQQLRDDIPITYHYYNKLTTQLKGQMNSIEKQLENKKKRMNMMINTLSSEKDMNAMLIFDIRQNIYFQKMKVETLNVNSRVLILLKDNCIPEGEIEAVKWFETKWNTITKTIRKLAVFPKERWVLTLNFKECILQKLLKNYGFMLLPKTTDISSSRVIEYITTQIGILNELVNINKVICFDIALRIGQPFILTKFFQMCLNDIEASSAIYVKCFPYPTVLQSFLDSYSQHSDILHSVLKSTAQQFIQGVNSEQVLNILEKYKVPVSHLSGDVLINLFYRLHYQHSSSGVLRLIKWLLENGISTKETSGIIYHATEYYLYYTIPKSLYEDLLKYGFSPNTKNQSGKAALGSVLKNGSELSVELLPLLYRYGADYNYCDSSHDFRIYHICIDAVSVDIIKKKVEFLVEQYGVDINEFGVSRYQCINLIRNVLVECKFYLQDTIELFQFLMNKGADIYLLDENGRDLSQWYTHSVVDQYQLPQRILSRNTQLLKKFAIL